MDSSRSAMYRCVTCVFACAIFSEMIDHVIIKHPDLEIKIQKLISKTPSANLWQTTRFVDIIPNNIKAQGGFIYSDNSKEKIRVSKFSEFHFQHELFNQTDIRSPLAKKVKIATSTPKKVQFDNDLGQFEQSYKFESLPESKQNENDEAFKDQETNYVAVVQDAASSDKEIDNDMSVEINYMSLLDDNENDALLDAKSENDEVFKDQVTNYVADIRDAASSDEEINNDMSVELSSLSLLDNDENGTFLDELSQLLPSVLQSLERSNQKETFMKFARMVASGHFPLHNIAYLLFMDIVEWFSSESTSQMRYSEDVKKVLESWTKTF